MRDGGHPPQTTAPPRAWITWSLLVGVAVGIFVFTLQEPKR